MPRLSVGVPHSLGQEEATRRLKNQAASAKERFGEHVRNLQEEWDGNALRFGFTAFGFRIEGTLTSGESEVRVDAKLPLVAMSLKGTIEQQIRGQLGKILG
jgi:hypothetical protein